MRLTLPSALALALAWGAPPAAADGWPEAIESVKASQQAYEGYAAAELGSAWAGNMYAGYIFAEHRCAILGRRLGMPDLIGPLEAFDYPPMDARSDAFDLLVFSISLDHWVAAAEWATGAEEYERINVWNLDCAGHHRIPLSAMLASERPEGESEADGEKLRVNGDIDADFAPRFAAALAAHPGTREIVLGSGGGSVRDAIETGLLIQRQGLSTSLHGSCYSACLLVFTGGVDRLLWASPNRLGFHQVSRGGQAVPLEDPVYGVIGEDLAAMGADPAAILPLMWSAVPSDMAVPHPRDLCGTGIVTWVQRIC